MKRQWERDLEDPQSDLSRFERQRAAARAAQVECVNLSSYVREVLDGAVGDIDLPTSYTFAPFGQSTPDGLTDVQRPVLRQIEATIVRRARPLTSMERERLGLALVLEWNRRAALEEQRTYRAEWLADFQAGDHHPTAA